LLSLGVEADYLGSPCDSLCGYKAGDVNVMGAVLVVAT